MCGYFFSFYFYSVKVLCNYIFKGFIFGSVGIDKIVKSLVECGYYVSVDGVYIGFFCCNYFRLV